LNEKSVMGRGLRLLEALSRAGRPLPLADLARVTQLPKSTVHRLVNQFVQLGLLDRSAEGFSLGLRMFEWGSHAERQRHLRMAAIPFLSELHTRIGETVHL
ncbi:helix-turn-helix domain-containing protein, partial [Campylobacter coli]|uniref:helix-turn-helix domain-containing protein n=1 Tax=Campylobacter coli TaxID=195 RepID=UPI003CEB8994